jgi:hypothetical protein
MSAVSRVFAAQGGGDFEELLDFAVVIGASRT